MRASDLLGARVVDADGVPLGYVSELLCSLDGPADGPLPAPRLRALVVSTRRAGASLGYQQPDMRGPWLVAVLVRRLHRGARTIPWEQVDDVADGQVRLRASALTRSVGRGAAAASSPRRPPGRRAARRRPGR